MRDFQKRVVNEKSELDAKRIALNKFFSTELFMALPDEEKKRMRTQLHYMDEYSRVLGERITGFAP